MNNDERSQWIDNDEYLYDWWRSAQMSMERFIVENRQELDKYIATKLSGHPAKAARECVYWPGRGN